MVACETSPKTVLKAGGGDPEDLVSLRTFLPLVELVEEFHAPRKQHDPKWFPSGNYPANTPPMVTQLYRPALVSEKEGIAPVAGPERA